MRARIIAQKSVADPPAPCSIEISYRPVPLCERIWKVNDDETRTSRCNSTCNVGCGLPRYVCDVSRNCDIVAGYAEARK